MFEVHETKDGDQMLIAQMSDRHLENYIKLACSKIQACVQILESQVMPGSAVVAALRPEFSQKELKKKATLSIRHWHETIQPYVLEATLRGLPIKAYLQSAYGRTELMPTMKIDNFILPSSVDDFGIEEKFKDYKQESINELCQDMNPDYREDEY